MPEQEHMCKRYEPLDGQYKALDPCPMCSHWIKIECEYHLILPHLEKEYEESRSFRATDYMMRTNRGVRVD